MRTAFRLMTGAVLALMAVPALAGSSAAERGEAKLAKALAGREAGKPVTCLNLRDIQSTEIFDRTAIVYRTSSNKLYVNRPRIGASSLDKWDVLVSKTYSSQLCSIDTVRLWDSGSRMETGFVGLGEFVPYTKVADAR